MTTQLELGLDLDVPSRIARLPLKKGERELLQALAALGDDQLVWSGPQKTLAERLQVTTATVGRRAKRASEAGFLDLACQPGRPSRYAILLEGLPREVVSPILVPTRTTKAVARDLRSTCLRVMGLLVELVVTAVSRSAPTEPPTKRRRRTFDPRQLHLWVPTDSPSTPKAPPTNATNPPHFDVEPPTFEGVRGHQPPTNRTEPPTEKVLPPTNPACDHRQTGDSIDSTLSTSSPCPNPLSSISKEGGRASRIRWGKRIQEAEFSDPEKVQRLFEIACGQQFVASDDRKLFFALCCNLVRMKSPEDNLAGLLSYLLSVDKDQCGQPWRARASTEADLLTASDMIRRLDVPAEVQARTSDLTPKPSVQSYADQLLAWQRRRAAST